ncbi:flippase [Fusobacterium sp. SYSU M8D902]|uniref:flippase n=1 Tax=Fusobacterium sp. SYSU M8D902 TaxID=3159562 RepID=UPI0032E497F5
MNGKKIFKNYIYNMLYQFFIIITPLITTPYVSKVFGAEKIGIYSYTLSVATYFMVVGSLGFPLYGQREIAIVSENKRKRSSLFFQIILAQLILILIVILIYLFFVFNIVEENRQIYLIQTVGLFGASFATSWFYMGIEKFEVSIGKNIFVKIFSIVTIFLFVKSSNDLYKYTFIIGFANVLGNLIILIDIKKYVSFSKKEITLKKIICHLKPAFILGIPYYITVFYTIIDRIMLGFLGSGYQELGYYEQAQKILTLAIAIITTISTVLLPVLSNKIEKKNYQEVQSILLLGVNIVLILGFPIVVGLVVIGDMLVPWFFGKEFIKVGLLIKIFAPLPLFVGITDLIANKYLIANKKEKNLIYIILISVLANIILNLSLIPKFNSLGAAYATILAEFIKLIITIIYVKDYFFNILFLKNLVNESIKYMFSSIVMFIILILAKYKLKLEFTFINTLLIICLGMIIYIICLIKIKSKYIYYLKKLIL